MPRLLASFTICQIAASPACDFTESRLLRSFAPSISVRTS